MKITRLLAIAARCVLGGVILLVALAAACGLFERISGHRHLEHLRRELTANGTLLPLGELVPPPASEAIENGKKFLAAIEPLKKLGEGKPAAHFGPITPRFLSPGVAQPLASQASPLFENSDGAPMPKTWDEFAQQLAPAAPILDAAKKLLSVPMVLAYDYSSDKKPIPLGETQELVAWLRADAALRLHRGDVSGAIDDVIAIQQAARLVGSVHLVIAQVLKTGLWLYGSSGLCWEILQASPLTDSDLARFSQLVSSGNFMAEAAYALQTEAAMLPVTYRSNQDYAATKGWDFATRPDGLLGESSAVALRNFLWPYLWAEGDQAAALSSWGSILPEARHLLAGKNWSALSKGTPQPTPSNYDLWRYPFSGLVGGEMFHGLFKVTIRAEVNRQLILTAIALERYFLKNKRYPERLDQLQPDYLSALPSDWFDGQPLKYRLLAGDQYLLYAIGLDGVDNHGDATPAGDAPKPGINTGRDVVWPRAE